MSRDLDHHPAWVAFDAASPALGMFTLEAGYRPAARSGELIEQRVVVVLDFEARSRQAALGHALHGLARNLIQRHQRMSPTQAPERMHALLTQHSGCAVAVVMRLPDDPDRCDWPREAIDAVMAALFQDKGIHVDLVIAVAQAPHAWSALQAVRHFIAAGSGGTVRATASATRLAASLMAPYGLVEVDPGEIEAVLGSATAPARLFHGQWSDMASAMTLELDTTAPALEQARAVLVLNEGLRGGGLMARSLLRQWRGWCPLAQVLLASITHGFFEPQALREDVQDIVTLCRFDTTGEWVASGSGVRRDPSEPCAHT